MKQDNYLQGIYEGEQGLYVLRFLPAELDGALAFFRKDEKGRERRVGLVTLDLMSRMISPRHRRLGLFSIMLEKALAHLGQVSPTDYRTRTRMTHYKIFSKKRSTTQALLANGFKFRFPLQGRRTLRKSAPKEDLESASELRIPLELDPSPESLMNRWHTVHYRNDLGKVCQVSIPITAKAGREMTTNIDYTHFALGDGKNEPREKPPGYWVRRSS